MMSSWQPIIGLEVHVELKTKNKMFCSCLNKHFGEKPNSHVCPVCLGLPGALPVPNQKAIEETIIIALAFNCQINKNFWFDRKNYFYPDLPKGYQISQNFSPIGIKGNVPIMLNGKIKKISLDNIHLEEDTGKLIHKNNKTLIDFNRSGVPLVEIVSKPVIRSAEEAKAYLKRLQQTIRWLGFSDCDMEKGSMRLEANISVRKTQKSKGKMQKLPDYKVEIKNLNSFRFVEKAINYEVKRQIEILKQGKQPKQETRGFDVKRGTTYPQRGKESAKDYRYFPEPDIPPFEISDQEIGRFKKAIGDLPWAVEKKIVDMKVRPQWAQIVAQEKNRAKLFFEASKIFTQKEEIANWLVNKKLPQSINAEELVKLIKQEKNKFDLPEKEIARIIQKVIKENCKAVKDYKKGKTQVIGFMIGQVQRKTKGRANPETTRKLLLKSLD